VCGKRVTGSERELPSARGAPSALDLRLRDVKCYYIVLYNLFRFAVSSSDIEVWSCIMALKMMLMEAVVSYFEVLIYSSTYLRRLRKTIYNLIVADHKEEI
jgi:hypothetical protein